MIKVQRLFSALCVAVLLVSVGFAVGWLIAYAASALPFGGLLLITIISTTGLFYVLFNERS